MVTPFALFASPLFPLFCGPVFPPYQFPISVINESNDPRDRSRERFTSAIDAKRHHTSQNLAHEVIKEAREGLKKSEQLRLLKIKELAQKAAESE
jgi:hypothetical protein